MLIVAKIIIAIYMWVVVPVLLGSLWLESGKKIYHKFISTYLIGLVSEWAVFFVLVKWAIARELVLHELCIIWLIILGVLTVFSLVCGIKKKCFSLQSCRKYRKDIIWSMLSLAVLMIISIVCGGANRNEYTVESVFTMYATDTLYEYDATTGRNREEMLSFEVERLENEAKAPIAAYYAASSYVCKLDATKFVRILLPIFLFPFYFSVYFIWAKELFGENRKKRAVFQIIIWLLYGSVIVFQRAVLFDVFFHCWNGETLFFAGLLPMAVWFLLQKSNKVRWMMQYIVCALSGQLLYIKGGFIISFLWGIALLGIGIKRWKNDSSI